MFTNVSNVLMVLKEVITRLYDTWITYVLNDYSCGNIEGIQCLLISVNLVLATP
jgi:hypothetical protein